MPGYGSSGFMDVTRRMDEGPFEQPTGPVEPVEDPVDGGAMPVGYEDWKRFPCRGKTDTWTDSKTGEEREAKAKTPLIREWGKAATADNTKLSEWRELYPGCMWGLPTGTSNGVFVVDLDCGHAAGNDGVENLAKYCAKHGHEFPQTLSATTAGGGMHLYFRMPSDGTDIRNSAGKILPGVDVRGTGGYVIVPPSMNLDTGNSYQWDDPSQSIVEAPAWLLEELILKKTEPRPAREATSGAGALAGMGTAYGCKALEEELEGVRNAPKGARNATLNTAVFKIAGLVKSGELKDGNAVWSAFEEAARETGLSSGEIQATMKSAWSKAEPRTAPARPGTTATGAAKPGDEGFEWPEPVSFSAMRLPKLTRDMLPELLGDYCAGLAEEKQVPLELAVSQSLAALATAATPGYRVKIRSGYIEPLNLYTLCPLEPANRKSSVCTAVMEPLHEWENDMAERLKPEIDRARSRRKTLEKTIDHKRTEAAKATTTERREALQQEIEQLEAELPDEIKKPRLLTDSPTPEALAVLMEEQGENMSIMSAEGGFFDILGGMYNNGVPNLDLFLKAWSGDTYRVDRKLAGSIMLTRPLLVMGITSQPITLMARTASKAFRGRGLDARFLYFLPESLLGRRKVEPELMNEEVKNRFKDKLKALLPLSWGKDRPQPYELELCEDAYREWLVFAADLEKELAEGGEFDGLKDWGGKLAGTVARLAGLFHLVSYSDPGKVKIGLETMQQACALGSFLVEHAKAAYALMGTDETLEGAKKILSWIGRKHAGRFTTQEAWQALRGTFHHMPSLREALKELEDRFYLYEIPVEGQAGPGRKPAPSYLVNPKALEV